MESNLITKEQVGEFSIDKIIFDLGSDKPGVYSRSVQILEVLINSNLITKKQIRDISRNIPINKIISDLTRDSRGTRFYSAKTLEALVKTELIDKNI